MSDQPICKSCRHNSINGTRGWVGSKEYCARTGKNLKIPYTDEPTNQAMESTVENGKHCGYEALPKE